MIENKIYEQLKTTMVAFKDLGDAIMSLETENIRCRNSNNFLSEDNRILRLRLKNSESIPVQLIDRINAAIATQAYTNQGLSSFRDVKGWIREITHNRT